jgi:hypothetical protein
MPQIDILTKAKKIVSPKRNKNWSNRHRGLCYQFGR